MELIRAIYEALRNVNLIFVIPLFVVVFLFIHVVSAWIRYRRTKRELIKFKPVLEGMKPLVGFLKRQRSTRVLLEDMSEKVSYFNSYSGDVNNRIAALVILISATLTVLALALAVPKASIWYLALFSIAVIFGVVGILYFFFTLIVKAMFLSKLPETYKLLNARYITHGNILRAIQASMPDFSSVIRREMRRVYDVLKNNDMRQVERTFNAIEKIYNDEYLTILLQLIWQAHFKGGNEVVREQFEEVTEDVLIELENRKDISSTTRSYIALALLITPPTMWVTEKFTKTALLLEESAPDFYSSPLGIGLKILIILILVLFSGYLLFLEKTE